VLSERKYCQLFTHESNIFFVLKCIQKRHPEPMGEKPPKPPLSLARFGLHLMHPSLGRSYSPSQTPTRSPHALLHKYATKSHWLYTTGCPTFTPEIAPSPSAISTPSIHPSLGRPHSAPQAAFRSNQPFFHNSPTAQTDMQMV